MNSHNAAVKMSLPAGLYDKIELLRKEMGFADHDSFLKHLLDKLEEIRDEEQHRLELYY